MQHVGEVIRQVRRLRNLTQQELAGERFSKSYVSAIEHNRTAPSAEALRYFAERLGQPNGDFASLLQQPDVAKALTALQALPPAATNGLIKRDEALALLYVLLERAEADGASPSPQLPRLSPEALASLPPRLQARYHFLAGHAAREDGDFSAGLRALESALALSPIDQQAAILDEMGRCYYLQRTYLTALGYHLHARDVLSQLPARHAPASLRLAVELHCGQAYQALGAYPKALECYEAARGHLSANHDLATAAQVYAGLGYLIYAVLFPATMPSAAPALSLPASPEQIEHEWQRVRSFYLQGVSLYQTSGDHLREAQARLTLAFLLLDWHIWRRRLAQARARNAGETQPTLAPAVASLLDDAAEQCRQVLIGWQAPGAQPEASPAEFDTILYVALACLIRVSVQRARAARLEGKYLDLAYRERAVAASLSQQVIETLASPAPPWALVQQVVSLSSEWPEYRAPALPHFTDPPDQWGASSPHSALSMVEIYFAAGEVAGELGRSTPTQSYAHDCYTQADRFFRAALSLARTLHLGGERDPGYLSRLYARYIGLLEERAAASPALAAETNGALLQVLKQGFWELRHPLPDREAVFEHEDKEER